MVLCSRRLGGLFCIGEDFRRLCGVSGSVGLLVQGLSFWGGGVGGSLVFFFFFTCLPLEC